MFRQTQASRAAFIADKIYHDGQVVRKRSSKGQSWGKQEFQRVSRSLRRLYGRVDDRRKVQFNGAFFFRKFLFMIF